MPAGGEGNGAGALGETLVEVVADDLLAVDPDLGAVVGGGEEGVGAGGLRKELTIPASDEAASAGVVGCGEAAAVGGEVEVGATRGAGLGDGDGRAEHLGVERCERDEVRGSPAAAVGAVETGQARGVLNGDGRAGLGNEGAR